MVLRNFIGCTKQYKVFCNATPGGMGRNGAAEMARAEMARPKWRGPKWRDVKLAQCQNGAAEMALSRYGAQVV